MQHLLAGDERVAFAQVVAEMDAEEVPCTVCTTDPGDVIAFNIRTWHCSIGGGNNRRSLNLDIVRRPSNLAEEDALCRLGKGHASSNRSDPLCTIIATIMDSRSRARRISWMVCLIPRCICVLFAY